MICKFVQISVAVNRTQKRRGHLSLFIYCVCYESKLVYKFCMKCTVCMCIKYISSPFGQFFSGEINTALRSFDRLHFSVRQVYTYKYLTHCWNCQFIMKFEIIMVHLNLGVSYVNIISIIIIQGCRPLACFQLENIFSNLAMGHLTLWCPMNL
jgi:hypothetical protein